MRAIPTTQNLKQKKGWWENPTCTRKEGQY
jgi:hypothetical protein